MSERRNKENFNSSAEDLSQEGEFSSAEKEIPDLELHPEPLEGPPLEDEE